MSQPPTALARVSSFRWVVLALLVAAGLVLFLWYAPETAPVATPTDMEQLP